MKVKQKLLIITAIAMISGCSSQSIKGGSDAPADSAYNFSLPDQNGKIITLTDVLKGRKGAVVAFYPKDESKN